MYSFFSFSIQPNVENEILDFPDMSYDSYGYKNQVFALCSCIYTEDIVMTLGMFKLFLVIQKVPTCLIYNIIIIMVWYIPGEHFS